MKLKLSCMALLLALPVIQAQAAALSRTPQNIDYILENNHYLGVELAAARAKVKGHGPNLANPQAGFSVPTGNISSPFVLPTFKARYAINEQFGIGLKYEQPFGIDVAYNKLDPKAPTPLNNVTAEALAHNLTALGSWRPMDGVSVYGGIAYQRVGGDVGLLMPGKTLASFMPYELHFKNRGGFGGVIGAAYEMPEIALRASVTYRSAVKYDGDAEEKVYGPLGSPMTGKVVKDVSTPLEFKLPQSINIRFRTGIMEDTVLLAGMRWVDWSSFKIAPAVFKQGAGRDLVRFSKDSFEWSIGLGRRFNDRISGMAQFTYDTGNGNPISVLGPADSSKSLSLAAKYAVNKNMDVSLGVTYRHYDDTIVPTKELGYAKFTKMKALGAGLHFDYRF